MPKFTYIGDEPSVFVFGLTFPKGVPVEVADAHALKKLPNHPHFRPAVEEIALPPEAPEIGAALTPEDSPQIEAPAPKPRARRKKETAE
jgi:hypothetical protein